MRSDKPPEALLPTYRALTPRLDVMITVDVPVEVSLSPMRGRRSGFPNTFSRRSDEDMLKLLRIADNACHVLVDRATREGTPVIRCDGNVPPEESVRRVATAFKRMRLIPAPSSLSD